jgi:transcriptional regulator with XRE-family HTH domain
LVTSRKSELDTRQGRLRFARKRKYAHATDAARAMGIQISTYLGHENGSRGFDDDAPRYAAFFGVSLDWLLERRGPAPGENDLYERILDLPAEKRSRAIEFIDFLRSSKS